jgi:hypothetical protein
MKSSRRKEIGKRYEKAKVCRQKIKDRKIWWAEIKYIIPMILLPLANAGVPMLFVQAPALIITLPIGILIEALICANYLQIPKKNAFGAATIANLISTVIGFPVLWFALVLIQMLTGGGGAPRFKDPWLSIYAVTVQAAWVLPFEEKLYWMVPSAMLILLVPTFFMSVFVEQFFYRRILRSIVPDADFIKASWKFHLASYGFLFALGLILLAHALITHKSYLF